MILDRYAKSICAAILSALFSLQSGGAWVTVAIAFFTTLGLVWAIPNALSDNDLNLAISARAVKRTMEAPDDGVIGC